MRRRFIANKFYGSIVFQRRGKGCSFNKIVEGYFTADDVWQRTKLSSLDTVVSAEEREEAFERVRINGLENIRNAVKDTGDDREYPVMLSACALCAKYFDLLLKVPE